MHFLKFLIHNYKFIILNWPLLSLLILNIVLFATNYVPGTYLTGWDNLHPEFNPLLNIKRSIFAVWQEYQSLGLLGGMGHASDLIRQIYVLLLSFIAPPDLIRYITTYTSLFLGGLGSYYLIRLILAQSHFDNNRAKAASFLGALFYTLNIATIQSFYVPFEAFVTHFSSLPWLFLASIIFITKTDIKSFGFLVLVLLLSTPASYIPTLFVVFMIGLTIYVATRFIFVAKKKQFSLKIIKLYTIIAAVNAFWLLPFLYFTLTNSGVNVNAKMNQMATASIFAQNREFGNLLDVALLRGFWFNNVDPNINGNFAYMLSPFREHFENPFVVGSALFLFGIAVIGAILTLVKLILERKGGTNRKIHKEESGHSERVARAGDPHRAPASELANEDVGWGWRVAGPVLIPFVVLFLFAFTMLATDAPVFAQINELFRKIPLFDQAFRFPFTKFSILTSLTFSILLAVGFSYIIGLIREKLMNHKSLRNAGQARIMGFIHASCFAILAAAILWITSPVFTGNLFYEKGAIEIPDDYFEVFAFFDNQDPHTRIANLPQPTFWGWTFYRWGYGGSGFLWYGLEQPILDRAFDVWSTSSENYYFELSQALYSKNQQSVENVLNKYQVNWILVDKNVIYPNSPKSLIYDETEVILNNIETVELAQSFGNIDIYKVDLVDNPTSFVFTEGTLPVIQTDSWNTIDIPYSDFGNYATSPSSTINIQSIYPFGSLFSQKESENRNFEIYNHKETIEITKVVNSTTNRMVIPNFYDSQSIIPVIFTARETNGESFIEATVTTPDIFINRRKVSGENISIYLAPLTEDIIYPLAINVNGVAEFALDSAPGPNDIISTGFFILAQDNQITISSGNSSTTTTIPLSQIFGNTNPKTIEFSEDIYEVSILIPKINDGYISYIADIENLEVKDCNDFRSGTIDFTFSNRTLQVTSQNDSACIDFFAANLFHRESYAIFADGTNNAGRPFHFWVLNEDNKSAHLDTYFDSRFSNSYVIPPLGQDGRGYSFHMDNISIGNHATSNSLSSFEVFPIPFDFITGIKIGQEDILSTDNPSTIRRVRHPNESLYIAEIESSEPYTLILSQSYDPGWKAYKIKNHELKIMNYASIFLPFIFGEEIGGHIKVNNWANGWIIDTETIEQLNNQTIVIVYLPQYLEFAGFSVLGGILFLLFIRFLRRK